MTKRRNVERMPRPSIVIDMGIDHDAAVAALHRLLSECYRVGQGSEETFAPSIMACRQASEALGATIDLPLPRMEA